LKKPVSPYPRLTAVLLGLTLLGLFFPLLQNHWKIVSLRGLNGVVAVSPDSLQHAPWWWDRSWQEHQERQFRDSLVLRPACVRLRNQLEYSCFHKLNAQQIYEYKGIFYRFYRSDFNETQNVQDTATIRRQIALLKAFQQKCELRRCPVITLIAPSKAHYFASSLPARNRPESTGTNYHRYLSALQEAGLEVLDVNRWFLTNRGQQAPVFGKGGIHWTLYASVLAMDSLVKRVGSLTGQTFQRPAYYLPPGYHLYDPDQDIIRLCNLMYTPKDPALRTVEFRPAGGKRKLKALIISDSFFHVVSWSALRNQVFDEQSMFLYYYQTYIDAWNQPHPIDPKAIDTLLSQADCVLILSDIVNLEHFGFGFLEEYVGPRLSK
jgi:alginate O-acetyltransferase complex protein AlgJ